MADHVQRGWSGKQLVQAGDLSWDPGDARWPTLLEQVKGHGGSRGNNNLCGGFVERRWGVDTHLEVR